MGPAPRPPIDRLMAKVKYDHGCWTFTGTARNQYGYGGIFIATGKRALVHRVSYEALVGPIPPGHDLDHLCRNRMCCNPAHMEPVTRGENVRRGGAASNGLAVAAAKTHCPAGHELSGDNLDQWTLRSKGIRSCGVCRRARQTARRRAMRGGDNA